MKERRWERGWIDEGGMRGEGEDESEDGSWKEGEVGEDQKMKERKRKKRWRWWNGLRGKRTVSNNTVAEINESTFKSCTVSPRSFTQPIPPICGDSLESQPDYRKYYLFKGFTNLSREVISRDGTDFQHGQSRLPATTAGYQQRQQTIGKESWLTVRTAGYHQAHSRLSARTAASPSS